MNIDKYKVDKNLPLSMKSWYFDFWWDQDKLWTTNEPVQVKDISELIWHMDVTIWSHPTSMLWNLSPNQVLNNPGHYPKHQVLIEEADLSFPIQMMNFRGIETIMDGYHRLARCVKYSIGEIKVQIIPVGRIPEIAITV